MYLKETPPSQDETDCRVFAEGRAIAKALQYRAMCFILNGWPGGQRKDRARADGPVRWSGPQGGHGASRDETGTVPGLGVRGDSAEAACPRYRASGGCLPLPRAVDLAPAARGQQRPDACSEQGKCRSQYGFALVSRADNRVRRTIVINRNSGAESAARSNRCPDQCVLAPVAVRFLMETRRTVSRGILRSTPAARSTSASSVAD